jgi:hypothetical protein
MILSNVRHRGAITTIIYSVDGMATASVRVDTLQSASSETGLQVADERPAPYMQLDAHQTSNDGTGGS